MNAQVARPLAPERIVGVLAAALTSVVVMITFLAVLGGSPVTVFVRQIPSWLMAVWIVAAVALVGAAWLASLDRVKVAPGLATATAGLFIPVWAAWPTLGPEFRAASLALAPLAIAGACHVGLRWRHEGNGSSLLVIYALTASAVLVHLVGYNPLLDRDCVRTCETIRPVAGDIISTRAAVTVAGLLSIAASLVAALPLGRGWLRGPTGYVAGGALAAVALLAVSFSVRLVQSSDLVVDQIVIAATILAAAALGVPALVRAAAFRQARVGLDRLVAQLAGPASWTDDGAIHAVDFAVPGEDRWVDGLGRSVDDGPSRPGTVVVSDIDGPVLRLVVDESAEANDVLAGLTPTVRLALRNAQLAAATSARLAEVEASQRRIVANSDAERRRIERDLHDGAQQRLVSAAFHVAVAGNQGRADRERLADVEATIHETLARLRALGKGIFPVALANEGLAAAIEDSLRPDDPHVTLDIRDEAMGPEAASTAYATVASALAQARREPRATAIRVQTERLGDMLTLRVEIVGGPPFKETDLDHVSDRIEAIGGRMTVERTASGTALTGTIPCG